MRRVEILPRENTYRVIVSRIERPPLARGANSWLKQFLAVRVESRPGSLAVRDEGASDDAMESRGEMTSGSARNGLKRWKIIGSSF